MNRDLPGFYYDEKKKRYFKIEPGSTAPANAEWSADNVKKRKLENEKVEQARKRHEKTKSRVKRSPILEHPLLGGRLVREFGIVDPELPVKSWTAGLREKGGISFLPGQEGPDAPHIQCMLVNGDDDKTGLGVVYATTNDHQLVGGYVPTDKDHKINFNVNPQTRASRLFSLRREGDYFDLITSITYHKPSHHILVASTGPHDHRLGGYVGKLCFFNPALSENEPVEDEDAAFEYGGIRPNWLLGSCNRFITFQAPNLVINTAQTAPASHSRNMTALLATNHGIARISDPNHSSNTVHWVSGDPSLGTHSQPEHAGVKPMARDVFSVDFHPTNPNVVFAGDRGSKMYRFDTRTPVRGESGWEWWRHRSSVAHLRSLDDNQILAAGPRSSMAIYDLRWAKKGKRARPVVLFGEYQNDAHIKIGLDVATDVGLSGGVGGGVVAAAHDDGTVGIHSLRTGQRLSAGAVDDPARLKASNGVIKSLQFEKMPWEKNPSLFAAEGPVVKKFSFGGAEGEDGW